MPGTNDSDEAYHEYLWGEASPRAFARRVRVTSPRNRSRKQTLKIELDASTDPRDLVAP